VIKKKQLQYIILLGYLGSVLFAGSFHDKGHLRSIVKKALNNGIESTLLNQTIQIEKLGQILDKAAYDPTLQLDSNYALSNAHSYSEYTYTSPPSSTPYQSTSIVNSTAPYVGLTLKQKFDFGPELNIYGTLTQANSTTQTSTKNITTISTAYESAILEKSYGANLTWAFMGKGTATTTFFDQESRLKVEKSKLVIKSKIDSTIATILEAYFSYCSATFKLNYSKKLIDLQQSIFDEKLKLKELGQLSNDDIREAKLLLKREQISLLSDKKGYQMAKTKILRIAGFVPDVIHTIPNTFPSSLEGLLQNTHKVMGAQLRVKQVDNELKIIKIEKDNLSRDGSLDLTAAWGKKGYNSEDELDEVSLSLVYASTFDLGKSDRLFELNQLKSTNLTNAFEKKLTEANEKLTKKKLKLETSLLKLHNTYDILSLLDTKYEIAKITFELGKISHEELIKEQKGRLKKTKELSSQYFESLTKIVSIQKEQSLFAPYLKNSSLEKQYQ
jgi:outer membrane protein TolC